MDADGDGIGDNADDDDDEDGVIDGQDQCPNSLDGPRPVMDFDGDGCLGRGGPR